MGRRIKHDEYNRKQFGTLIREVQVVLKEDIPRGSGRWTHEDLAIWAQLEHPCRGAISHILDGRRALNAPQRERLIEALTEGLQAKIETNPTQQDLYSYYCERLQDFLPAVTSSQIGAQTAAIRLKERDISFFEALYGWWGKAVYNGQGSVVLQEASDQYHRMLADPDVDFRNNREEIVIAAQIGEMITRAQEITFKWGDHYRANIRVFNEIEQRIFLPALERFADNNEVAKQYATMLAARALVARRLGHYKQCIQDCIRSLHFAKRSGDDFLYVDLALRYAHVWACLGMEEDWRRAMEDAEQAIMRAHYSNLNALKIYHMYQHGEGLRRLAYNPFTVIPKRKRVYQYAAPGLEELELSHQIDNQWYEQNMTNGYVTIHPLHTRIGEAQCKVWTAQDETMEELRQMREDALREYPSRVGQIEDTIHFIGKLSKWSSNDELPCLDVVPQSDAIHVRAEWRYEPIRF
jgi:hypothetical protein